MAGKVDQDVDPVALDLLRDTVVGPAGVDVPGPRHGPESPRDGVVALAVRVGDVLDRRLVVRLQRADQEISHRMLPQIRRHETDAQPPVGIRRRRGGLGRAQGCRDSLLPQRVQRRQAGGGDAGHELRGHQPGRQGGGIGRMLLQRRIEAGDGGVHIADAEFEIAGVEGGRLEIRVGGAGAAV
jgi:hypothetical protein